MGNVVKAIKSAPLIFERDEIDDLGDE